jgi:RNA polymerase sigma-70 factor, ECF subfamily
MGMLHPKPEGPDNSITALLSQRSRGDRTVEARLIPHIYGELHRLAARSMRIVELHCFAGPSFEEITSVIQVAPRTVKRDWSMARAFLKGQLSGKS